ncbi:hypothetical protein [Streptomyces sp. NPDC051109]|uniref:hypothetical protein n=1 Tax=Streptomyces sp. NPDC051109 TaxID=3365642 RepID=UPI003798979B
MRRARAAPGRLPESSTAPTNSSHISPSSGNPDAGTGEMPTIERTREAALLGVRAVAS